jgi:uncharacterized protein (DUF58 family)
MKRTGAGLSAGSAMTETGHDPDGLMRIKNLQLRARAVVEGFYNGLHRSPFHGFSVEFSEYRPYTPGDDPRGLDWKLYARSDRYYIKRFEDETNRHIYLILDRSRSMGFGSLGYDKGQYAVTLAATLTFFFSLQRDSIGLLTFGEAVGDFIAAKQRPGHFRQLMVALSRPLSGNDTNLDSPMQQISQLISRRGLVILISDLLAPIDTFHANLSLLRSRGHEVMVLRIIDPAETRLEIDDATTVVDMESGRERFVDPDAAREEYERNFNAHRDEVRSICESLGVNVFELLTDRPIGDALHHVVSVQRGRRGRGGRRGFAGGGTKGGAT